LSAADAAPMAAATTRAPDEPTTTTATATATSAASPGAARAEDDDDDSAKAYLESTVTRALHDAMCALNAARPEDPLVFLGRYLLDVAAEGKGGA
jgi:hypothetical protein